jgi:hypothetical protein
MSNGSHPVAKKAKVARAKKSKAKPQAKSGKKTT